MVSQPVQRAGRVEGFALRVFPPDGRGTASLHRPGTQQCLCLDRTRDDQEWVIRTKGGCHCTKAGLQPTLTEGIKSPTELQDAGCLKGVSVRQHHRKDTLLQGQKLNLSFAPSALNLFPG